MPSKDDCPCSSGLKYRACCAPYHRGEREAPDAEALMRSRYAAFARKDVAHLWRTLHPDHEERAGHGEAELTRALRATVDRFRYTGLSILDRSGPDQGGIARVLFLARVFEKGADRSFVELSEFAHDGEGWRYLRGESLPVSQIAGDPLALRIESFGVAGPARGG